jgi:hypothetical protein
MSTLISKPIADAVDVSFNDDELIVTLVDGRRVSAPLAWFPRLLSASPAQRKNWRLIAAASAFTGMMWMKTSPSAVFSLHDVAVRTTL